MRAFGRRVVVTMATANKTIRVHYKRPLRDFKGFGLHVWGDAEKLTTWQAPLAPTSEGDGTIYWDLPLKEGAQSVGVLVHRGEEKDGWEGFIDLNNLNGTGEVWIVSGKKDNFLTQSPETIPIGSLGQQAAHWVSRDTLLWRVPGSDGKKAPTSVRLHVSEDASLNITGSGIHKATRIYDLNRVNEADVDPSVWAKFPFLKGCTAFKFRTAPTELEMLSVVKGQLGAELRDSTNVPINATGVQIAGVLDERFYYDGPLGCTLTRLAAPSASSSWGGRASRAAAGAPQWDLALWSPTALSVDLLVYTYATDSDTSADVFHMTQDKKGVWRASLPCDIYTNRCYVYRIRAYHPMTNKIETMLSPDPYSRACTSNSKRTFFADPLTDPAFAPPGWDQDKGPTGPNVRELRDMADIVIYEAHVRDFSATDPSVPDHLRGKYLAFALEGTHGVRHLQSLVKAGVTHVHLLPINDFATVPEKRFERAPDHTRETIARLLPPGEINKPSSDGPQRIVTEAAARDSFNWGYDPVLYFAPEGSYCSNPDSPTARVLEARRMVMGLHRLGLRVVVDVVFNHTFESGPHLPFSVLDKCVPGYYHRRGESGDVLNSTCCNNTACENSMMGRLVVDACVYWARAYHLDGLRYDIMGHLMLSTVLEARDRIAAMTKERDGVDGAAFYHYGEAWDWGEMVHNARGPGACIANLKGTGIGSFNDRIRDNAMGGGPFSDPRFQGWVTGLATLPRPDMDQELRRPPFNLQGSPDDRRRGQLWQQDGLRLAMAGSLRDYTILSNEGKVVRGRDWISGDGVPVGFAQDPPETINYVACHDNRTLWDLIALKAPRDAPMETRVRMHMVGLALVALSQGIPFVHAGDDLLRSKSLDRDSYNSGDYFNRVDWTGKDNNWGIGLPPWTKNGDFWGVCGPLLDDPNLKPSPEHIGLVRAYFLELLNIRWSSKLFRLPTAFDVNRHVKFHNQGPAQVVGLLVMELQSLDGPSVSSQVLTQLMSHMGSLDEEFNPPKPAAPAARTAPTGFSGRDGKGRLIPLPAVEPPVAKPGVPEKRGGPLPPEMDRDPRFRRILVVINASNEPNKVLYPPGVGDRLALHPDMARSVDPRVKDVVLSPLARAAVVPAWTSVVLVERWPIMRAGNAQSEGPMI